MVSATAARAMKRACRVTIPSCQHFGTDFLFSILKASEIGRPPLCGRVHRGGRSSREEEEEEEEEEEKEKEDEEDHHRELECARFISLKKSCTHASEFISGDCLLLLFPTSFSIFLFFFFFLFFSF